jgi:hypothetical protein
MVQDVVELRTRRCRGRKEMPSYENASNRCQKARDDTKSPPRAATASFGPHCVTPSSAAGESGGIEPSDASVDGSASRTGMATLATPITKAAPTVAKPTPRAIRRVRVAVTPEKTRASIEARAAGTGADASRISNVSSSVIIYFPTPLLRNTRMPAKSLKCFRGITRCAAILGTRVPRMKVSYVN